MKKTLMCLAIACVTAVLAPASNAQAQSKSATAQASAPVPSQILAAKSVFIANGGYDSESLSILQRQGDGRDSPYNQFYTAMKAWGRYSLASAPADADLVFTIRMTSPMDGCGDKFPTSYAPQLTLTIADVKTHFALWSITEPPQNASFLGSNWKKNFALEITQLMNDLKTIASAPSPAQ